MDEKTMVEFTKEEFDKILQYQEIIEGDTVQDAIINAVNIALEKAE